MRLDVEIDDSRSLQVVTSKKTVATPEDAPQPATPESDRRRGIEARVGRAVDRVYRRLGANRATRLPWAVIRTFSRAEGGLLSGSMAYFTFLSLPPLLLLAGAILGSVSTSSGAGPESALIGGLARIFPDGRSREILEQLGRARAALSIFGVITLGYATSGFMNVLTGSLHRIWEVPPRTRNPIGQRLLNLGVIALLGLVLLGSVAMTIWVRYLVRSVLGESASPVVVLLDRVVGPLSLFVLLLVAYRVLPARPLSWRGQMPGAAFAAVGTELLKAAFGFWARHSAGIAALPRSMLSAVLVLLWLGFFSQVVLYGAALNAVLWKKREHHDEQEPESA
ncbi:MAG: YihY/virulence factor BrkB family protein [Actinomycetota bacterium]